MLKRDLNRYRIPDGRVAVGDDLAAETVHRHNRRLNKRNRNHEVTKGDYMGVGEFFLTIVNGQRSAFSVNLLT